MTGLLARLFIKDYKNTSDPEVRTAYGILTGTVGIVMNFLLFAGKLAVGLITGAVSVSADAFNNLSDAGSSVVSVAGYKLAAVPPDREHPFGHGRAEYIAGFVVSAAIIFTAFEICTQSVAKIFTPEELNTDIISVVILCASILVKLYMFAYNRRIGKLVNSVTMRAVAVDSLSDCAATLAVIAALIIYMVWGINLDGFIGLLISVLILKAGISAAKESIAPLLGMKADDELIEGIRKTVLAYDNIVGVHDLIVHNYGVNKYVISLHTELPADLSFTDAHETVDRIETELREKYSAVVTIHMDPVYEETPETEGYKAEVVRMISSVESSASMHDFRVTERGGKRVLIFDVEVPFGLDISDEDLKQRISEKITEYDSSLSAIITIDKKIY